MIRVIKVGGSLFDLFDLRARTERVLNDLPPATNVLVAGCGKFADLIREAQPLHGFSDENAHWICVRALSLSAEWLRAIHSPDFYTDSLGEIKEERRQRSWVFDPSELLEDEELSEVPARLPRNWTVTSDSIAAVVATELKADELILFKSIDLPDELPLDRSQVLTMAAREGFVDEYFPFAATGISRIGWLNLRSQYAVCRWLDAIKKAAPEPPVRF